MGETTFKGGPGKKNYANDKVVISDARMKLHDKYTSLRTQSFHLGNASSCAKLLRNSVSNLVFSAQDSKMVNRCYAEMRKVLKKDKTPHADHRQIVQDENMVHMLGFNFNDKVKLRVAFNVPYRTTINRETGELTIKISSFKPVSAIRGPKYATHFKIVSNGIALDFANNNETAVTFESALYKIDSSIATDPLTIILQLTPGSTDLLGIALGLLFSDESGNYYVTHEQRRVVNPLCLVDVNFIERNIVIPEYVPKGPSHQMISTLKGDEYNITTQL